MDTQAPSPSSLQAPKPPSPCSCTAHVQRLRRERLLTLAALIAWMAGTSVWTSQAQGPRTIDERVADLEKRVIGAGGSDGITRFTAPFQVTLRMLDAASSLTKRVSVSAPPSITPLPSPIV